MKYEQVSLFNICMHVSVGTHECTCVRSSVMVNGNYLCVYQCVLIYLLLPFITSRTIPEYHLVSLFASSTIHLWRIWRPTNFTNFARVDLLVDTDTCQENKHVLKLQIAFLKLQAMFSNFIIQKPLLWSFLESTFKKGLPQILTLMLFVS